MARVMLLLLKNYARSYSLQVLSFSVYMLIVFVCARLFDIQGYLAAKSQVDGSISPHSLKTKEIKALLMQRGVTCNGCVDKGEFVQLLEETGPIYRDELENSALQLLPSPAVINFESISHFERSVRHGIWLTQIIPGYGTHFGEQLLQEEVWNSITHHLVPYRIHTATFNCIINVGYCIEKDFNQPLLVLTIPTDSRVPIVKTSRKTKKQAIMAWLEHTLSTNIHKIVYFYQLEQSMRGNIEEKDKVVFVTHLDKPSLTFTMLSNTLIGMFEFEQLTVTQKEFYIMEKLRKYSIPVPSFVIIAGGRVVILEEREYKSMDFDSLSSFIQSIGGNTFNKIQLLGWNIVNMVTLLQIFQVCVQVWKKNITLAPFFVWCLCSFLRTNIFYIIFSYTVLFLSCLPVSSLVVEGLGKLLTYLLGLSSFGSVAFSDWLLLQSSPIIFYSTLFLFGIISSRVFTWPDLVSALTLNGPSGGTRPVASNNRRRRNERETSIRSVRLTNQRPRIPESRTTNIGTGHSRPESPDINLSNLRFRVNLETREVEYTSDPEGLAYRNLRSLPPEEVYVFMAWIRIRHMLSTPFISNDYIKDLPTWRSGRIENQNNDISDDETPPGMTPTYKCVVCQEEFKPGELLCGLPCGHYFHEECIKEWLPGQHKCPLCRWPAYRQNPN